MGKALTPDEFQAAMAKAGPQVAAAMSAALLRYATDFAMGVVPRLVVQNLHNRRGQAGLAGSFRADPLPGTDPGVVVYTHSPYARLQEKGGTVTAKGKMLTIPVGPARTGAGVTKGGARAWPAGETFVGKTPGGHLAIMLRQKDGDDGAVPIFLLRRQVTIPPRLGLLAAWDREDGIRKEVLGRAIERGLAAA